MEKEAQILSAKRQLKLFGKFINNHTNNLNKLLNHEDIWYTTQTNIPKPLELSMRPISIDLTSNSENMTHFKLIESDNKVFNKTILTFTYLCNEIEHIMDESNDLQMKFLYLDQDLCTYPNKPNDADIHEYSDEFGGTEECLIKISNSMEFLCQIQFVIKGAVQLANCILQQLSMYHSYEKKFLSFQYNLQFHEVFRYLENLMIILLTFDEILSKSYFQKFWPSYKKTIIQSFQQEKFTDLNCNENEINGLFTVLNELESLFAGNIYQIFLESTYRSKERLQATKGLTQLSTCFNEHIKETLLKIRKFSTNLSEFHETKSLIALNTFFVLHHHFFGQIDQKMFKQLLEFNTKYNGITLIGSIIWYPENFLRKHAETLIVNHERYFRDSTKARQQYLMTKIQTLPQTVRNYYVEVCLWVLKINTIIENGPYDLKIEHFKMMSNQLILGTQYAGQLSHLIRSITNLHELLLIEMSYPTLCSICKMIELLKIIQFTLSNDIENIAKFLKYIKQCSQYKCLHIVISIKKKLSSQNMNDQIVDTILALKVIEKCMNGPPTKSRLFIINLLCESENLIKILTPEENDKLQKNLARLKILSEFQYNLNAICDLSFIYWHQSLIQTYFKEIIDKNIDLHSFNYMLYSSDNCSQILDKYGLCKSKATQSLKRSNYDLFKHEIVSKLCGNIETFLRLEVHSNLHLEKVKPFEQIENFDSRTLLNECLVLLDGRYTTIKYHIENYLSNMFYNLTTIHLHDWKAYEGMRQLAKHKYNLIPIDDYLPTQTLEQGIDALEIMRKINVFVTKYNYSMNNQYFVEKSSNSKYLNTIGIHHVANSIRTHGSGIINTTVNFSYQFLRQKFYTFSQFLYDQQINSRLMKEYRYICDCKKRDTNDNNVKLIYNYERADDFNKEIRKLGSGSDGLTYMDMFRQLITQVGNTMGYIRLIRSGNVHANYTASIFLPNFDTDLKFENLATNDNLSSITIKSAEILESNIKNYGKHYSEEDTDFFKLLVNAFKPFFQNPNNIHLRNFFLIIPPLIINYVEYILNARERLTKREKSDAVLFDDGFAMGLAYILKLLNQFSEFESLHWFKSIENKFEIEHKRKNQEIQLEVNKNNKDESLLQTLALVEKRMNAKFREYSLLYDSLYSAKIFFQ